MQTEKKSGRGGKRPGAGRPMMYDEPTIQANIHITPAAIERIRTEALKRGLSVGQLVSEWAQSLPPSPLEKTRDMNRDKEVARELK